MGAPFITSVNEVVGQIALGGPLCLPLQSSAIECILYLYLIRFSFLLFSYINFLPFFELFSVFFVFFSNLSFFSLSSVFTAFKVFEVLNILRFSRFSCRYDFA